MSNAITLSLTPRDPLIARDGRPFVAGLRMKSLDWFYPAVVAGSLRTMLGNLAGGFASNGNPDYTKQVDELKSMQLAGPFPSVEGKLYFPFPHDVEVCRNRLGILEAYGARPVELANAFADTGCDLPVGLEPVLLPELNDQFKPETKPAFISTDIMAGWLVNDSGNGFPIGGAEGWPDGFLQAPAKDRRMHVAMDYDSGAGKKQDGLFQTVGLDLYRLPRGGRAAEKDAHGPATTLSLRLQNSGSHQTRLEQLDTLSPLGGERRLVHWQTASQNPAGWACPKLVLVGLAKLSSSPRKFVRLILATPAIFRDGWKPAWLRATTTSAGQTQFVGRIPDTQVTVRLISACVGRWQPISGWGYEHGRIGAKPVRRMVPAGSVYFLEVVEGDVATLADRWLESVSDNEQDRRDGFGLALWGSWSPVDPQHTFLVE